MLECILPLSSPLSLIFFFFRDTATTAIYTLSLHDALPISSMRRGSFCPTPSARRAGRRLCASADRSSRTRPCCARQMRSEEHTSELQSHVNLVCRLLHEKKKTDPFVFLFSLSLIDTESIFD